LLLLGFLALKLSNAKSELVEAKASYQETAKLSTALSGLKDVYADKDKVKKSVERILKTPSLASANIEQKQTKSGLSLNSQSIDITALNSVMGKFLNASFNIATLKIKKLSPTKASLYMEITW
jgi:hypothetical protein